jgi:hypothetical protein
MTLDKFFFYFTIHSGPFPVRIRPENTRIRRKDIVNPSRNNASNMNEDDYNTSLRYAGDGGGANHSQFSLKTDF